MNSDERRLKNEIRVYSRRYETELQRAGLSKEKISGDVNKWVDETCEFYIKSGYNLPKVIECFAFLNMTAAEFQTETVEYESATCKIR